MNVTELPVAHRSPETEGLRPSLTSHLDGDSRCGRRLRCLVLADTFPDRRRPSRGPYNAQQVAELAKLCDVGVVNPIAWTSLLREPSLLAATMEGSDGLIPGVAIRHPVHWYVPVAGRWRYGPTLAGCVRRACRRDLLAQRWDIVYATWAHPHGYAAMRIAEDWNVPFIIKVRGTDINVLSSDPGRRRRTAHVLASADAVVAVSGELAEKVIALGAQKERVHVIHNGVDTERFRPRPRLEARRRLGLHCPARWIVFVGNLVPVKGLDVFLAALALLDRNVGAAIVGTGPLMGRLRAMTSALGIVTRVTFAGDRPHDEIPLWLSAGDLTCLPSRNEGCPNVVLESLACGRPVVASRVGAVPDLIGPESGMVVEPGDPMALADALGRALARSWSEDAIRATVQGKTWPANARRLVEIMERAIAARLDGDKG